MMHAFAVVEMQRARNRNHGLRHINSRQALALLLAHVATPASRAAVSSVDVHGNGRVGPTTERLLLTQYNMAIRGPTLTGGAFDAGAIRTPDAEIESHLVTPCARAGCVGWARTAWTTPSSPSAANRCKVTTPAARAPAPTSHSSIAARAATQTPP
jgi:hypothetical protein